jgi:putative glycosyltransferase
MKLSVVTTLYKSSLYVDEFYARITAEAKKITDDYEIIFIDDGSPDDSLKKCIDLHKKDKRVKVIELSRNFGHHKAIMTGLSHTEGEFVFLIDVDLEEEPELLGKFWEKLQSSNNLDVVYGVQEKRKGGLFEKWSGDMFYTLFNAISGVNVPRNLITCRLATKKYNDALILHKEQELFLGGLLTITGFKQEHIVVKKLSHSKTTYDLRSKLSMMINSITSFSNYPLKIIFYSGMLISGISFMYILYILYQRVFLNINLEGWTSLIVSIWFLGGLVLLSIGIIGIYLSKIFIESKNRPYTIIRNIFK